MNNRNMQTITLPKSTFRQKEGENIFSPPPAQDIKEIIKEFRATGLYNPAFFKSLEKGLKRSPYFRYENSSPSSRN